MSDKLYDTRLIEQMSHGKVAFVKRMLQVFAEDAETALSQIEDAIAQENHHAVQSQAHSLKSNLDLLKIDDALEATKEIERLAKEKSEMNEINTLFTTLREHLQPVIRQINDDLKQE